MIRTILLETTDAHEDPFTVEEVIYTSGDEPEPEGPLLYLQANVPDFQDAVVPVTLDLAGAERLRAVLDAWIAKQGGRPWIGKCPGCGHRAGTEAEGCAGNPRRPDKGGVVVGERIEILLNLQGDPRDQTWMTATVSHAEFGMGDFFAEPDEPLSRMKNAVNRLIKEEGRTWRRA